MRWFYQTPQRMHQPQWHRTEQVPFTFSYISVPELPCPFLLSAQRISNIGQIIKSICVSVSESVSPSHKTSWTLYRSQSSTDFHQTCQLPPRWSPKIRGYWLRIVFGGNLKYFYPPACIHIICTFCRFYLVTSKYHTQFHVTITWLLPPIC